MEKSRRKELLEAYKQIKIYMGIYQVKNNVNGKCLIGTCSNLKSRWLTLRGMLEEGRHPNALLQKDWTEFGADAFTYDVLEQKEVKEDTDTAWELKMMEKAWLEKLQPYGDKGYHKPRKD